MNLFWKSCRYVLQNPPDGRFLLPVNELYPLNSEPGQGNGIITGKAQYKIPKEPSNQGI
jgi:hypothetical protein